MNDDTRPDAGADAEPAVAARLRATLAAAAAATPTEDRSVALLEALDARPDVTVAPVPDPDAALHLQPLGARRRPAPKVWLLGAAAAAVVAVVATAVILDDEPRESVVAEPGAAGTGWYVPPEGWEVVSVQTEFLDVGEVGACPCTYWTASEVGDDPAAVSVQESTPPDSLTFDPIGGYRPIDVDGRPGQIGAMEPESLLLAVQSGGRQLLVYGSRLAEEDMVEVADGWLDRTDAGELPNTSTLPLPEGFERSSLVVNPAVRSVHLVEVVAEEAATGQQVTYSMVPTDWFRNMVLGAASSSFVDGAFQVVQVEAGSTAVGIIGGPADVVAGMSVLGEVGALPVSALEAFVAGLRQVPVAEWRAALATAADAGAVDPAVLEARSLYDEPLVDGSSG